MKIQGCPSGSPLSMKLLMPACLLLVMPPPKCFLFVVQHIFVWKMIFLVYVSFRLAWYNLTNSSKPTLCQWFDLPCLWDSINWYDSNGHVPLYCAIVTWKATFFVAFKFNIGPTEVKLSTLQWYLVNPRPGRTFFHNTAWQGGGSMWPPLAFRN